MEILHAFGIDYRLLIIQIVNFAVLLLVLWRFLYRPLLNMMDSRREIIAKGVRDADEAEQKLRHAQSEKNELLKTAAQEADAMSERARKDATEKAEKASADAHAKASRILAEAQSQGEELKARALEESKREIAKLVVLGMEKTFKEK